ncbi:Dynein light chain [Spironucleus salmonicida]|uniref:Dynein light chain n=1 Tax=Spironucleus salmonicida TaxID=348837 RepID=V6M0B9_9EUKA|nr:Dynein light chain [Spironucleus salmonicida]|eukprot:EST46579.1 Dynein light chain [Spironucleus salmonicida]
MSSQNIEKRGDHTITFKVLDMPEELYQRIIDLAVFALEKFNVEREMASQLQRDLNREFGQTWHVIVGKNFGFYGTHESQRFCYFTIGAIQFLCFKSR